MAFNLIMATSPLGVKDLTKQFDYKTVATDLYELYGWRKASDLEAEIADLKPIEELKQILKVLEKYNSKEQIGSVLFF